MASTSASTSNNPTAAHESFIYDVFLSFRGIDTRNNFTGHLYERLVEAGIHTFMDDPKLRKGGEISSQLIGAIEESSIYIVVFSENYATSRWCLDELVHIRNQCDSKRGRLLIPVFFGVQPSDVRYQKGRFEEALRNHEASYINRPDLIEIWRAVLTRAANCSGYDLQRDALGSESRLISLILKEVLLIVNPKKLFVAKYPVGLDSSVNDVYSLLSLESQSHVQFIGIWGMGGSGKSVIAKALYNKILQSFDSSCFLANVRQDSQQPKGLVHLQKYLISELLIEKNDSIDCVDRGIEIIRKRLRRKKVLIVLDDLDTSSQVDALAGHRDWFGLGSVIIITTRDQHLLTEFQGAVRYEAKELNSKDSLELFSWHSFKTESPLESYAEITIKIVAYCWGLPLALVVLGSYLGGRPVEEWISAFKSLQKIPDKDIQEILKISYDSLDNDEQRGIFLDIACFFIGMDVDYVTEILNGCGYSTKNGIAILKYRCLLTIDIKNELRIHDLLRDMGREIIRQQCPLEPGKRSRVWSHQEATKVLMRNKGTEAIEGVSLVSPGDKEIQLETRNFSKMHNLRLLNMDKVNLRGDFKDLSEDIKWCKWQGCSLEHLPSSFEMPDLVVLEMKHSKMNTVWLDFYLLEHLKILNLSHSKCLTSTPDFTRVPNLVSLILEGCTSLLLIDPSIGCLHRLLVLNIKGCVKITDIPSEVCLLESLGYLNLSGCSNLKELPRGIGNIESVKELYADETAISQLLSFFAGLKFLTRLSLRGCTQLSTAEIISLTVLEIILATSADLRSLRMLNLRDCDLMDHEIPYNIGKLSELQDLDLAGNRFRELPDSFKELKNLKTLSLDDWSILPLELAHLKPTSENISS